MGWWKSLQVKAALARHLSLSEWWMILKAWGILLAFNLALRRQSYERLEAATRPTTIRIVNSSNALEAARRQKRLVEMAARVHLPSTTCLVRALSLRWILGRQGLPSQIRIGAQRTPTGIQAHAWLEIDGQPVGEPEAITGQFKVLGTGF